MQDKENGFMKLNQAIESGERLYPNTATEGREQIRQEIRGLRTEWDSLFDELSAAQRKLDNNLVQWMSIDESFGQLDEWLRNTETNLRPELVLRATLEEKKGQLQSYKVRRGPSISP